MMHNTKEIKIEVRDVVLIKAEDPVDTERELNVHNMFRSRPGLVIGEELYRDIVL